jgi:hypothetical protein
MGHDTNNVKIQSYISENFNSQNHTSNIYSENNKSDLGEVGWKSRSGTSGNVNYFYNP